MGVPRSGRRHGDGDHPRIESAEVIGPSGAVRVMVATKPVDFRKGAEGLAALVRETMTADPFSGAVYVFRAKRADRVKLIFWDGTGVCLFAKRLEDGKFRWPRIQDGVIRLSPAQLSALLEGLDWRRVHVANEPLTPALPG
jgi:transposase